MYETYKLQKSLRDNRTKISLNTSSFNIAVWCLSMLYVRSRLCVHSGKLLMHAWTILQIFFTSSHGDFASKGQEALGQIFSWVSVACCRCWYLITNCVSSLRYRGRLLLLCISFMILSLHTPWHRSKWKFLRAVPVLPPT